MRVPCQRELGLFGKPLRSREGFALPTVLGAVLLLAVLVSGVAIQVRASLRLAGLDSEVAQSQTLVWSALMRKATEIHSDLVANGLPALAAYGSSGLDPTVAPAQWPTCTLEPLKDSLAEMCADRFIALEGAPDDLPLEVGSSWPPAGWPVDGNGDYLKLTQIPIVVFWRLSASDELKVSYGWVIADPTPRVLYVFADHRMCRTRADWIPGDDACETGG